MSRSYEKIVFKSKGPILSGSIHESRVRCGKKNCRCYEDPEKRHVAYLWSGMINGKNTTRYLNKETVKECRIGIQNYKDLQEKITQTANECLANAPWVKGKK